MEVERLQEEMSDRKQGIEISRVTKYFGPDQVLKEINLFLERGRVYGIVGNNGSGKTVLMKCICGFLTDPPDRPQKSGNTGGYAEKD